MRIVHQAIGNIGVGRSFNKTYLARIRQNVILGNKIEGCKIIYYIKIFDFHFAFKNLFKWLISAIQHQNKHGSRGNLLFTLSRSSLNS